MSMFKIYFLVLTNVFLANVVYAQYCHPNVSKELPDSRYQIIVESNGSEILDRSTNLIWQRCSIGQIWNGTTCAGQPIGKNWVEALSAVKLLGNGYRLPNIKELNTLVETSCNDNSINEKFFPNTAKIYLSSSPAIDAIDEGLLNNRIWFVDFSDGHSDRIIKSYSDGFVRAVRSKNPEVQRTKDQVTTISGVQYTKSKTGTTLFVSVNDAGISDSDGVTNVVYKMYGSPKPCDFRTFYTKKEYIAKNNQFSIEIPADSCGYSYYLYAEADVLNICTRISIGADGKSITTTSRTAVHKRSKVYELKDSQDTLLNNDPFGVIVNIPNTCL